MRGHSPGHGFRHRLVQLALGRACVGMLAVSEPRPIQWAHVGDVSPAVQCARRAGGTDALVKPDERQGGRLAGCALTSRLQGRGKVAIAHGPSTVAPLALRVAGFLEELRTSPGIAVVENVDTGHTQSTIRAAMAGFLDRHPDLAAVYCVNDPRAHFCELEALGQKRTDLVIVGMEGSPNSVASMKNPQGLIVASPASDPYALAETAVHIGAKVRGGSEPAGSVILVPFTPLDRDHLSGYSGWTR